MSVGLSAYACMDYWEQGIKQQSGENGGMQDILVRHEILPEEDQGKKYCSATHIILSVET